MIGSTGRTPAARHSRASLAVLLFAASIAPPVGAQDSTASTGVASDSREGWIVGPLLGLPGAGSDFDLSYFTLGLGVTRLAPNRPGVDFAVGTVPRAIPDGVVPIGARLGLSIPVALGSDAFIVPSAGLSGIGAVGGGGLAAMGGFYWGAAAIVARGPVGFRAGVTWHRPADGDLSVWLMEIGVMRMPVRRHAPPQASALQ